MKKIKPFKIPAQSEAEITRAIRYLLKSQGIWHYKVLGGFGTVKGIPDIIGCFGGRLIAIEVKTKKGKLSPEQEIHIDRINKAGGLAFVARGIQDVIKGLGIEDRFLFEGKI